MTNLKKVTVILIAAVVGVIFAWHLILTIIETRRLNRNLGAGSLSGVQSSMESSISINPLTDTVTMTVTTEPDENPFSALGAALGQALLPSALEPMLNGVVSDYPPDPYASIVPYRVRVVTKSPDLQTLERLRTAREKAEEEIQRQKEQAEEAKLERVRAYVKDNLSIENLRAGLGSRTGDPPFQDTVEG